MFTKYSKDRSIFSLSGLNYVDSSSIFDPLGDEQQFEDVSQFKKAFCWKYFLKVNLIFAMCQTESFQREKNETPAFLKPAAAVGVRDPTQAGGQGKLGKTSAGIRYEISCK